MRRLEGRRVRLRRGLGDEPAGQGVEGARGRPFPALVGAEALAEAQDRLVPAERRGRLGEFIGEARMDQIVPAVGRPGFGALIARDNEALSRAGHRDIEQAPVLAGLSRARLDPRGGDRVGVLRRPLGPGEERRLRRLRRREAHQLGLEPRVEGGAGVRQKDDRRLEPLAGVDGQHPHPFALDLHVALDLNLRRFDLAQKIVQRRRLALLVRQRQGQEFVDRVGGFGSEPAEQRPPAAVLPKQERIEGERRKRLRPRPPEAKPARGFEGRALSRGGQRFGERTVAVDGKLQKRVVVKPHQRRLER